jgi:hypothetical protein
MISFLAIAAFRWSSTSFIATTPDRPRSSSFGFSTAARMRARRYENPNHERRPHSAAGSDDPTVGGERPVQQRQRGRKGGVAAARGARPLQRLSAAVAIGDGQVARGEVVEWTSELMERLTEEADEEERRGVPISADVSQWAWVHPPP